MNDELDGLLDQLKNDDSLTSMISEQSAKQLDINDETVNEFILKKAGKLVEDGVDAIDALKQTILSGFEPDELSAYSDLIKSVVKAMDTMNKINIQNKKDKTSKELKEMDIDAQKKLPQGQQGNTNVLIATREEIMKDFVKELKDKSIDVEFEEDEEDKDEK